MLVRCLFDSLVLPIAARLAHMWFSLERIRTLPNADVYRTYAYHISLLKDFVPPGVAEGLTGDSTHGRKRTLSSRGRRRVSLVMTGSNGSFGSVRSADPKRRTSAFLPARMTRGDSALNLRNGRDRSNSVTSR
jgi:hypothetical protein